MSQEQGPVASDEQTAKLLNMAYSALKQAAKYKIRAIVVLAIGVERDEDGIEVGGITLHAVPMSLRYEVMGRLQEVQHTCITGTDLTEEELVEGLTNG